MDNKQFISYSILFFVVLLIGIMVVNYVSTISASNDIKGIIETPQNDIILTQSTSTLSQTYSASISGSYLNTTWLDFNNSARVHINENINYSLPYTVSFWMKKPSDVDASAGYIICKSDVTGNQRAWQFHTNTGNDLWYVSYPNGTNTNTATIQWNNFLTANQWYHIAIVNNNTHAWLYGNGVLINNASLIADPQTGSFAFDGPTNVTLGNCQSNAGFYNGSLDEVRLYNSALTYAQITDLYLIRRALSIPSDNVQGYFEDFSSYSVGNDTFVPSWYAQYVGYANITSSGKLQMNYLIQKSGDRDLHIQYNRSEISNGIQNLSIKFQFNVTKCNETFFDLEAVRNIGASAYLWYFDGDNFLSAEMKTNASSGTCGDGESALFTIYKRVAGVTSALNAQALYTFAMNTTYDVTLLFKTYNSTNYNFSAAIDGVIQRSSINITTSDIQNGAFLLEDAGTVTEFDNVNLTRTQYIASATNQYRLNENQGTKAYDFADSINGTIGSGATFNNDGVLNSFTELTASGTTVTLTNPDYAWTQITASYIYLVYNDYGFHITVVKLIAGFIILAIFLFLAAYVLNELKGGFK